MLLFLEFFDTIKYFKVFLEIKNDFLIHVSVGVFFLCSPTFQFVLQVQSHRSLMRSARYGGEFIIDTQTEPSQNLPSEDSINHHALDGVGQIELFGTRCNSKASIPDLAKSKSVDATNFAQTDIKEQFQLLMEEVDDFAIFMLDLDGNVISWNSGAEKIKGYQAEEVIGQNFSIFYSAEDRDLEKPRKQLTTAIRNGRMKAEGWRIRKDGSRFWANVIITALRDEAGNLREFSKIIRDLTAQKQAEDALVESERRERARTAELAITLDAVPMPIFITHDSGCLQFTRNRAAADLLKQPRNVEALLTASADVIPSQFRAVKDGRDLGTEELPAQMAARGIRVENFEFTLVFDDGTARDVLSYGEPLRDDTGQLRGAVNVLVDITDRRQAEKALRAREAQLHSFVQQAPAAIAMFDRNMNCLAASQYWTRDFGRGHGDVVGRNHYVVHPDLPERWQEIHRRGLAGEAASGDEELWLQEDGTRMWVSWVTQPWVDADGNIGGIIISTENVSTRKYAEIALREQEAIERSIIDSLSSHVALLNQQGDIVRVNLAWKKFAGENDVYEMVGVGIGANYLEVIRNAANKGDRDSASALEGIQGVLNRETPEFIMEYPYHSKTEQRWFLLSATPILSDQGGAVVSHSNITPRKLSEQALKNKQERLRSILNTAADAIVVINRKGRIDSVNPAAENIFGYSAVEMLGQNVKMLMPPPFQDEHDEYLRRYLETGRARIIGSGREVIGRRKDGTTFPLDLVVSAMDHLGLFTGILRDITERRQLERHALEVVAEEQRHIGQELHDGTQQELTGISMIAGTVHDLINKASQQVVAGKSVWMLDHAVFYRICDMTIKLNQRLSETSRNVHQLSHGIMPVQIDPQGLRAALQELTDSTNDLKGISCCLDCRIAGEVTNSSTATHLYRIAQEAVNNVLRHSQADQIEISLKQQDDQLRLEVRDNGVGFDPEDLSPNGLPGETKGMGLQIMAYRAGMIGGTLRVQRGVAAGTSVKCEIFKGVGIRGESISSAEEDSHCRR